MSERRVSGRQITAMVIAACAAVVLAPVGVMAASHSVVTVGDGTHPSHLAHVTPGGDLAVNVAGSTTVTGTVTSQAGFPTTPFTASGTSVKVPAGKHLVIQSLSALVGTHDTSRPIAELSYTSGGRGGFFYLPLTLAATISGADSWVVALPVTLYADPGTTVGIQVLSATDLDPAASITLSGYLV
jgi:hypothetical protein